MDEFLLQLIATLNQSASKEQINKDLGSVAKAIEKLKVQAEIDPNSVKNIAQQLAHIMSQKVVIDNVQINTQQVSKAGEQVGQTLGTSISNNLQSSLNDVKHNIDSIIKGFSSQKLNSYDLSKMFNLNRADIDSSVMQKVRNLTTEINTLAKEVLKTNSDNAWEGIINKVNSLSKVLNQFGSGRDLTGFKESLDVLDYFQNKKIFVGSKSDVLANTGMSIKELNNQFRNLGVTFTTVAEGSTKLDSIWTELFNISPNLQQFTNFSDQINAVVNHLKVAKEALYGNSNLQPLNGGEVNKFLLDWITNLENASGKIRVLQSEQSEIEQRIAQSSTSAANAVIQNEQKKQQAINETANAYKKEQVTMATTTQQVNLTNRIEKWLMNNTRATKEARLELQGYIKEFKSGQVTSARLTEIRNNFTQIDTQMRSMGKLGKSFFDTLSEGMRKFSYWISPTFLIMKTITEIRKAISSVTALDTALVDLRKTANMTAKELEDFYYTSNDVAKQMGVTTEEIISQAAAWSRLGFSSAEAATQMAKLSAQFKLISPGMDMNTATSGLVSIMKAYDIEVNDVLEKIMSNINIIGNNLALSNANIVSMLQDSVSTMAEGRNTLEETIALESAAYEIVQDDSVGNGFKTVSLRLRGLNEETQELDDSLKTIKGDLYDLTGVSIMEDADTYKSTYQILKEVSEVWDSLTDTDRAKALELMFGKMRSNIGAAVLKNFSAAEKAMDLMANSAGNATAELETAMDSIEFKANRLKETGTGIAQNLFKREDMKTVVDGFTTVGEAADWLTDKLGLFGTLGAGTGLFAGLKNTGRVEGYPS